MNLVESNRALRQLRLGGMAAVLETRARQAQVEPMAPLDLISWFITDELTRRADRLLTAGAHSIGCYRPALTVPTPLGVVARLIGPADTGRSLIGAST